VQTKRFSVREGGLDGGARAVLGVELEAIAFGRDFRGLGCSGVGARRGETGLGIGGSGCEASGLSIGAWSGVCVVELDKLTGERPALDSSVSKDILGTAYWFVPAIKWR
jgi:hypothetical protein